MGNIIQFPQMQSKLRRRECIQEKYFDVHSFEDIREYHIMEWLFNNKMGPLEALESEWLDVIHQDMLGHMASPSGAEIIAYNLRKIIRKVEEAIDRATKEN